MELPVRGPATSEWKTRYLIETKSVSYRRPADGGGELDWACRWWWGRAGSKPILRDVSCRYLPGEITAVVGPSGAGKTTLLSILAGMVPLRRVSGEVLVNGRPMDAALFRRVSGYVPQEDSLLPQLTVEESLLYSAYLRLGGAAAADRARELLRQLGLDHVAGCRVGSGISGGERRRVSIGVELVHRPGAILLDEPTSGLDSASAVQIISLLRAMARAESKAVVVTVHQPGFRILELIDQVVILVAGEVRHRGPLELLERRLKEAGHRIPNQVNALEYAMENDLPQRRRPPRAAGQHQRPPPGGAGPRGRLAATVRRSNQLFATKIVQSLAAGLGLGSVFMRADDLQARVGFFAFSLTFLLSSTTEALPVFLRERKIVARETSRGAYRVSSYALANAAVYLPLLLAAALLYAAPVYWLVGLRRELDGFLFFALVVWLAMAAANSLLSCVAALAPSFVVGSSAAAGLLGCFFLFSGYFIAKESIPRQWIFVHYLSLFKYPFEAFLINEYGGRGEEDMFLGREGLEGARRWTRAGVMAGFVAGYRVLAFAVLWLRCRKTV
ncbi:unnamed protein product [Spirodela intermedia]|uniref:ABC transporter domain-containing protein n=1 Tax=Spirodela intermedia TaxID=51605 RepID=A0A7I8ITD8_SPIIN|nr:unnamed protein product [Spirodela intermedia]CAA6661066.1 unnamed protein product [Spirodela intermedia]